MVPLSIAHGEEDSRVPVSEALRLWDKNTCTELMVCELEGHGFKQKSVIEFTNAAKIHFLERFCYRTRTLPAIFEMDTITVLHSLTSRQTCIVPGTFTSSGRSMSYNMIPCAERTRLGSHFSFDTHTLKHFASNKEYTRFQLIEPTDTFQQNRQSALSDTLDNSTPQEQKSSDRETGHLRADRMHSRVVYALDDSMGDSRGEGAMRK